MKIRNVAAAAVIAALSLFAFAATTTIAVTPVEAATCGGLNQEACPALKKGPQCGEFLYKDKKKICRACGGKDKKACPALAKGPQCRQWLRKDKKDICRACGGDGEQACPVLAKGKVCKSGLKKKDGKCRPDRDTALRGYANTIAEKMSTHLGILSSLRTCLTQSGRKDKIKDAVKDDDPGKAETIVSQCLSDSQRNSLRAKPAGLAIGTAARSSSSGNDGDEKFFNTVSIGVGAGGMIIFGGAADAGVVIDLARAKHARIYHSGETVFGAGLNISADLIVGLGRDPLARGKYRNIAVAFAGKFLAGGGLAIVFDYGEPSLDLFDGIAVSGGVGEGAEIGTIHKSKSRIWGIGCKDVEVTATNKAGKDVKVIDLDYYDFERKKWRSKLTMDKTLKPNESWKKTRRLKAVGLDETKVRVDYRVRGNDGKWGGKKQVESAQVVCENGSKFSVTLN